MLEKKEKKKTSRITNNKKFHFLEADLTMWNTVSPVQSKSKCLLVPVGIVIILFTYVAVLSLIFRIEN